MRIFLIFILLLLTGCTKNEFYLEFSLPEDINANYKVIYYASNKKGGTLIETVATVNAGKGSLRCVTHNPLLLYLYSGGKLPLVIYAERGEKIEISGPDRHPATWKIGGNDINKELSEWRNANAEALMAGNQKEIDKKVAEFITENPETEIAPILLLTSFSRTENEALYRKLWRQTGPEKNKKRWLELVSRADMLQNFMPAPGILKSMAMRSLGNGVDTIKPNTVKATLLFFWHNGMDHRNEFIDSLKSISKEYPDSASRLIADISVDPDSLSWRSPLRKDSVKNIARMWTPQGLADRKLMDLGVPRTPYFIVFSPDGHQIYRGDNVSDALQSFRELIK